MPAEWLLWRRGPSASTALGTAEILDLVTGHRVTNDSSSYDIALTGLAPQSTGKYYTPFYSFLTPASSTAIGFGAVRYNTYVTRTQELGLDVHSFGFYDNSTTRKGKFNGNNEASQAVAPNQSWFTLAMDLDLGEARIFDNAGVQIEGPITGLATGEPWLPSVAVSGDPSNYGGTYAETDALEARSGATPPAGYTLWPTLGFEYSPPSQIYGHVTGALPPALNWVNRRTRQVYGHVLGRKISDAGLHRRIYGTVFNGDGYIEGTVTTQFAPTVDIVRLYDRRTGLLLGETRSRADGYFVFPGLDPTREYFVVGLDRDRVYELEGMDLRVPTL